MNQIQERITVSFNSQGLMATLGAQLVLVADGEVQIALPFSKQLSQQHGYVHAGAITSVIDSACGYAALTKAPPEFEVVTAEFKINLLRPAIGLLGDILQSGCHHAGDNRQHSFMSQHQGPYRGVNCGPYDHSAFSVRP